jgi:hypothetical protein
MSILKIEPAVANSSANFSFGNVFSTGYFYANGAPFSSGSGTVKFTANTTPPVSNNSPGDQWYNTTSQILYEYINDGTGNYWVDVASPSITTTASTLMSSGNSNISLATSGNMSVSISGTSNVLVVSNTSATITGNVTVSGNIIGNLTGNSALVSNGFYSTNSYVGSYTSGIVVDYTTGTGRISVGTSDGISFYKNGVGNTLIHAIDANGNTTVSGALTVTGSTLLGGATTIQLTSEIYTSKTGATGVVTHDLTTGGTFYHTNPAANFTANFTNVPTTDARIIVVSLMIAQAGTAYMPTAVQIDGVAQTIKWINGSAPSGNASKTDIVSFSLQRSTTSWIVYGQAASYG